ncbi:MAG: pullulanase-type alpha-1,6-glucosidase, partial [Acidobacteriota bacterium]|nr:pullulanase-type alpha-1,6-glucosidase [Acidobacteriota bacterium]
MRSPSFARSNSLRPRSLRGWLPMAIVLGLCALVVLPAFGSDTPDPATVTVAGDLQEELGCPGDWQPDCAATYLTYDAEDDVWQQIFTVPAGNWQYKAPLNDAWTENYGLGGVRDGANIPLSLAAETDVKFFYDHKTHWITDNQNSTIVTAAGSFQSELGCSGDWQPWCLQSWLQDPDDDGTFVFETGRLPAGNYEMKAAHDEAWDENYGAGGVANGANIPFSVPADCADMRFEYDLASHVLTADTAPAIAQPGSVTIAGSLQSELGCPGDWQPDCAATHLAYDADDTVWQGSFALPTGDYEYKAAINDAWDENYGANATPNGPNIPLSLADPTTVKFYYDDTTHWVTSDQTSEIAVAAGSFQSELGCPGDWQPWCLRSWLQDPDGDGIFTFSTNKLPAGDYEVKVAHNEAWDENYGANGAPGGANIPFTVPSACAETFFSYDVSTHVLTVSATGAPTGNLNLSRAHWVAEDVLAWNLGATPASTVFELHWSATADLGLDPDGVTGADGSVELTLDAAGLPSEVTDKFPHLAGYRALRLDPADLNLVPQILKAQTAVSAVADGALLDATSIQIPGVLDDLFFYPGELGTVFSGFGISLHLWAPTAQAVSLHLYDSSDAASPSETVVMTEDPLTGVWSAAGGPSWYGQYYLYEVEVYTPATRAVVTNLVTDPYSVSLAADSRRSQIVSLDDPFLKPILWDFLRKPWYSAPEDIVLYELHVRDFSIADQSVDAEDRGTFKAFANLGSDGMRYLRRLSFAGLTHVHLLPSFDIATVPERREDQLEPAGDLASYPPDSEMQQAAIEAVKDQDGFNWGYDPYHYTVPEGSYATDPDGPARIREFRQMVQALNRTGLRVVMDVVYNHTNSAGQNDKSVLDKIVPGYYHRLNADGAVEMSSCCPNTASEHAMMEKLMIDSVLTWATQYKVDGFRFDLMGHHMKANMLNLREALDALTLRDDGVDGSEIYVYGEGWNFGEVADNARGINATQANMAGTGIGTFSDRLRDGVRGGNPFSALDAQGFINGLFYESNGSPQGDERAQLLHITDWIRVGLAGDIADYTFVDADGNLVRSDQVDYFGQQAGYTADPQENITYIAAHDNETLFDALQLKAADTATLDDRVRMQMLGNSIVALGQGIPFFHAGQDFLRSKSMDRDSFNSGDWFNQIDWTFETNNWGNGLPVAEKNQDNWPIMAPLLADPTLAPQQADLELVSEHFRELLRIRRSSKLFRLRDGQEVKDRVAFHNTGVDQIPGVVVMSVSDPDGDIDRKAAALVVVFNATTDPVEIA